MPTYLERYLAGDYELVWEELLALGAAVREQPLYADALAVARETMRRAKYNVETIVARLRANGYVFSYPHAVYEPAGAEQIDELDEMEVRVGPIPLSVRVCFEQIGVLILAGYHPDWMAFGKPQFIGKTVAKAMELELMPAAYGEKWEGRTIGIHVMEDEDINYGSKVGRSEIIAPDPSADGRFLHPDQNIAPTFVGYLRKCFEWGGFPGFANIDESLRPTEMLAQLTEGLLPI